MAEGSGGAFYIGYVTRWDARDYIRNFLLNKGKAEGSDFVIL
jgi:hypothetical protein